MDGSTGGGRYAWFFEPRVSSTKVPVGVETLVVVVDVEVDVERERASELDGDGDVEVEDTNSASISISMSMSSSPRRLSSPFADDGTEGNLTPSSSPSSMTWPSSAQGKKFLKSASACHLDACLNSIQTSMRPGRESAGSRRSRWFVVLHQGKF